MMKTDLAIARTRDARRQISASCGDDPAKLIDHYIRIQARFGDRLRHAPKGAEQNVPPDAPKRRAGER
jgi:hypothetical protein